MEAIDWRRFGMDEVPVNILSGPALDWAVAKADGVAAAVVLAGTYGKPDSCYMVLRAVTHHEYFPSRDLKDFGRLAARHGPKLDLQLSYREQSASFAQGGVRCGYTATSVPEAGCRAVVAALLGASVQVPKMLLSDPPKNARAFYRDHLVGAPREGAS